MEISTGTGPQAMNEPPVINRIAVIGEGRMGTSIFHMLLDHPYELVWICSAGTDTARLFRQLEKRVRRLNENGIISVSSQERQLRSQIVTDLTLVSGCDLVIEAINEKLHLKRELFKNLASLTNKNTLLVSNTSSIPPSLICPDGNAGERFAGLHFFYPVQITNIIELTPAASTISSTVSCLESFLQRIDRRYLLLDEANAFVLNKIFLDVQVEGFRFVKEGILSIAQADKLCREFLFGMGLFDFCDSVGIEIMAEAVSNYISGYPDRERYQPFLNKLIQMADEGKTGIKTGEGFYHYPAGRPDVKLPANATVLADHLRKVWHSSIRRYTALAHIPVDDMNHACIEYFGLDAGPFG